MILRLLAYVYARRGVRAAWAAGPNAHSATYFPATTSPSVAKGVSVVPDLSLPVLTIDGQLIVRTRQREHFPTRTVQQHSQPRDEPRTGWSGSARPAPPKHQAPSRLNTPPLECRFELPRWGPRGTPALGRDFRGWSGSGVIVAEAMGGDAGAAFALGQDATSHLCGIVASDRTPQYWRHSTVLFSLLMGSPIIGPAQRTGRSPATSVPPDTIGASSFSGLITGLHAVNRYASFWRDDPDA